MSVYALDSNIISFYLKGNITVIENIEKSISEDNNICYRQHTAFSRYPEFAFSELGNGWLINKNL